MSIVTRRERFESGLIATLRRGDVYVSRHFLGEGLDRLRDLAAYCDRGGWKVVTISTPDTILGDLQGSRRYTARGRTPIGLGAGYAIHDNAVLMPEDRMLRHIGRLDLLDQT